MIGRLRARLAEAIGSPEHRAVQLPIAEPIRTRPNDVPGELLRLRPYADNDGMPAGATLLRSVYDPSITRLGRNVSDHHAFEVWCHDGSISFYVHATDERAKAEFRRRLANTYPDAEVVAVTDEHAFPTVDPSAYVAGATVDLRRHHYFPIRHHDGDGFASDPYSQLTGEMLSTAETSVVLQTVFRPAKRTWAEAGRIGADSVDDLAHGLRQGRSVGWLNPRTRPPSDEDERIATRLERQAGRLGFHANVRVLVVSNDPREASTRLRGIEDALGTQYDTAAGQGLEADPITHWSDRLQARRLQSFVERTIDRQWVDREMVLTVHELAGLAHLPNEEIGTPNVDWRHASRGDWIPADAPQFEGADDRPSGALRPDVSSAGGE